MSVAPIPAGRAEKKYAAVSSGTRGHETACSAVEGLRRVIGLHPGFGMAHEFLADVYLRQQRFPEALAAIDDAVRLNGDDAAEAARLRAAYEHGGVRAFWRHRLTTALQQPHPSPYTVAVFYAQLDDRERALDWLERAFAERDRFLIFVDADRRLAALATEARFQHMLRRVGA